MGETSRADDVTTRKLKSMQGATGICFLSFSKALCVSVTNHDLCSVSLIYGCLSSPAAYKAPVCLKPQKNDLKMAKTKHKGESRSRYRFCVHTVGECSAWYRRLSLRREPSPVFLAVPAPHSLHSCESQMDQVQGMKTGEPLSSSFPIRSSARSLASEARPEISSPRREGSTLRLSSSEVVELVVHCRALVKHCLHKHIVNEYHYYHLNEH